MCMAVLNNGPPRDTISCFENAFQSYLAAGDVRRATRCSLWCVDVHRAQLRPAEAAQTLLKASEKEPAVRGALLLEQAAYAFLQHRPQPLVRKYAFHLVMAGHLFHKVNQKLHGVRCYASAGSVYEGRGWFHMEDHINYNLGRDCFHLGDFQQAVHFFVELIGKGKAADGLGTGKQKQSAERQANFLRDFLLVVKVGLVLSYRVASVLLRTHVRRSVSSGRLVVCWQKWTGGVAREVPALRLPMFVDASVEVEINDRNTVPAAYTDGAWGQVLRMNPTMPLDPVVWWVWNGCPLPVLASFISLLVLVRFAATSHCSHPTTTSFATLIGAPSFTVRRASLIGCLLTPSVSCRHVQSRSRSGARW